MGEITFHEQCAYCGKPAEDCQCEHTTIVKIKTDKKEIRESRVLEQKKGYIMKWINVKKQKPPIDTLVLVYQRFKYGADIKIGEYVRPGNKKRPVFGMYIQRDKNGYVYGGYPLDYVTHWVPLPEPPKFRTPFKAGEALRVISEMSRSVKGRLYKR